jgi:hypothetical protein
MTDFIPHATDIRSLVHLAGFERWKKAAADP